MIKNTLKGVFVLLIILSFSACHMFYVDKFQKSLIGTWKSALISDCDDKYFEHYEVFTFDEDGNFELYAMKEGEEGFEHIKKGKYKVGFEYFACKDGEEERFLIKLIYGDGEGLNNNSQEESFYSTFSDKLDQLNLFSDPSDLPYVYTRQTSKSRE